MWVPQMDSNRRGRPDNSSAATLRMSWGIERSLVPRFGHWGAVSRIASPLRHYVHLLCINNTVQIMVDVTFCGQHQTPSSCAPVAGSRYRQPADSTSSSCCQSQDLNPHGTNSVRNRGHNSLLHRGHNRRVPFLSSWEQPRSFPGVVGGTVFLSRHSARNGVLFPSFCAERSGVAEPKTHPFHTRPTPTKGRQRRMKQQ